MTADVVLDEMREGPKNADIASSGGWC